MKDGVRWHGTKGVHSVLTGLGCAGRNAVNLFFTKHTVLTSVRIECGHGYPGIWSAEGPHREIGAAQDLTHVCGRHFIAGSPQRHVTGHEENNQPAHREHRQRIRAFGNGREHRGVIQVPGSRRLKRFLVQRSGGNGVDLVGQCQLNGLIERIVC